MDLSLNYRIGINMCPVIFWWTLLVLAVLPMVELDEVADGVQEHFDRPVSCLDRFKSICL